ncbi:MAG: DUF2946 family protein [Massilia sp.]
MKKLVKLLIVWIMLLAVPLQGFASATMMLCAPEAAAASAMPRVGHDHQAMLAAQDSAHHHRHVVAAHDAAAGEGDSHAGKADHHGAGKCGACSTCCYGAAMAPSNVLPVGSAGPAFETIPFAAGHAPAVDLAGPERPPQS